MKCLVCGGDLVKVQRANNGVGHVSKSDWVNKPHKAFAMKPPQVKKV